MPSLHSEEIIIGATYLDQISPCNWSGHARSRHSPYATELCLWPIWLDWVKIEGRWPRDYRFPSLKPFINSCLVPRGQTRSVQYLSCHLFYQLQQGILTWLVRSTQLIQSAIGGDVSELVILLFKTCDLFTRTRTRKKLCGFILTSTSAGWSVTAAVMYLM